MPKSGSPIGFLKSPAGKLLTAVFGILVGLFLWGRFFVGPQQEASAQLHSSLEKVRRDVAVTHQKISHLPALQAEINRLMMQEPMTVEASPEEQLPEIFKVIAQEAKTAQVRLLGVKTQEEISQVTPSPTGFLELPVQVDVTAGYHQLGQFLDLLEGSNNFFRVQGLKIQSNPNDVWHHQATVLLDVYLFPGAERSRKE